MNPHKCTPTEIALPVEEKLSAEKDKIQELFNDALHYGWLFV